MGLQESPKLVLIIYGVNEYGVNLCMIKQKGTQIKIGDWDIKEIDGNIMLWCKGS